MGSDTEIWANLQSTPTIEDASGGEVGMMTDLDKRAGTAERDVGTGKKFDVMIDHEAIGGSLNKTVGEKRNIIADVHDAGLSDPHEKTAHEGDVVADFDQFRMIKMNIRRDSDISATGFEKRMIIHGRIVIRHWSFVIFAFTSCADRDRIL